MILSAHQPAYLPWLGYFNKIAKSDIFIFLDSVQFEKNSFINRNLIKTPQGSTWLTIPVRTRGHLKLTLKDLEIDNSNKWKQTHLKTIYFNYKKAPRFEKCYAKIEKLFQKEHNLLSELCFDQLMFWIKEISFTKTRVIRSTHLSIESKKSDLILDLCKYFGADQYISGKLGLNYLKKEDFQNAGINIEFQDYKHPQYHQLWGNFIPNLSILDFWMNTDEYRLITGDSINEFFKRVG